MSIVSNPAGRKVEHLSISEPSATKQSISDQLTHAWTGYSRGLFGTRYLRNPPCVVQYYKGWDTEWPGVLLLTTYPPKSCWRPITNQEFDPTKEQVLGSHKPLPEWRVSWPHGNLGKRFRLQIFIAQKLCSYALRLCLQPVEPLAHKAFILDF